MLINILTAAGSVLTIIGFIYTIVRNAKIDINEKFLKMEKRIDLLDERMFYLSTGKTLTQAILEEKIKNEGRN